MKIIALFLFLFVAFSVNAQPGTFLKIFSGQSYEEGIKSFRLPNKTYRIVGNTGTFGWSQKNIWLIALDSTGNFMWHKTYGEGGLDFAADAQMDSHGNIYIVGSSTSATSNSYQMLLVGVDTNGHAFTNTYFGGTNWDFGNAIQLLDDTTIMLVGETYSYTNGQSNAWIVKAHTNGQLIWMSSIGGNKKESFSAIKHLYNGDFVCSGYSDSYGNGSKDPMLYRCNSNGDSIWLHTFKDTTDGEFYDLLINSDTNIIAVGYQNDTSDNYQDLSLMNIDINGQLNWNRIGLRHKENANIRSIISEEDKYITAGMSNKYSSGKDDIYGSLIAHDGWWNKSYIFGSKENDFSNTIVRDTSNGQIHYLITGTTRSYGLNFSGALFVRMDSDFNADTIPSVLIPSSIYPINNYGKITLNIYPNPCIDRLNIILPKESINQISQLYVYNTIGKLIESITIEKGEEEYQINTKNWPKASYFIVLKTSLINYSSIIIKN